MVLALQTFSGFDNFNDESTISKIVLTSILRELGPVLAGLMVCGRVGAKMAAEIATMRVSNQIDALETLSTRPIQYLISTRLLASIIAVPFLVFIGNIIGVFGGFIVSTFKLDLNPILYMISTIDNFNSIDLIQGHRSCIWDNYFYLVVILVLMLLWSRGSGRATTISVVTASTLILNSTYFITALFI